jgi:Ni/Co efflux regulator RcnB
LIAAAGIGTTALLLSTGLANAGNPVIERVEIPTPQPAGGQKPVKLVHPVQLTVPQGPQQKIKGFGNHYFTPNASKQQLIHAVNGHYFTIGGQSHPQFAVGPYNWPQGYGYMRYSIGDSFPQQFWLQQYFINNFADFGLQPPPPGYQWVRFGPDLMLVNMGSGAIAQVAYGAFAEGPPPNGGSNGQ